MDFGAQLDALLCMGFHAQLLPLCYPERPSGLEGETELKAIRSITVRSLCERFLAEYVPFHCKASTAKEYERCVRLFIIPEIGTTKIISVVRTDITVLHHQLRKIPHQTNRTLGVLSVMFAQAESWNLREALFASSFLILTPVFGLASAFLLLGEVLTGWQWIGVFIILMSVLGIHCANSNSER